MMRRPKYRKRGATRGLIISSFGTQLSHAASSFLVLKCWAAFPMCDNRTLRVVRSENSVLRHTTKEIADRHADHHCSRGDVLLCIIRNLRVAVVPPSVAGGNITQGMVYAFGPTETLILRDYLVACLQSPQCQAWMKRR